MSRRNRFFGSNEVFSPGLSSYLNSHSSYGGHRRRWGRRSWRRRSNRGYRSYRNYSNCSSSSDC